MCGAAGPRRGPHAGTAPAGSRPPDAGAEGPSAPRAGPRILESPHRRSPCHRSRPLGAGRSHPGAGASELPRRSGPRGIGPPGHHWARSLPSGAGPGTGCESAPPTRDTCRCIRSTTAVRPGGIAPGMPRPDRRPGRSRNSPRSWPQSLQPARCASQDLSEPFQGSEIPLSGGGIRNAEHLRDLGAVQLLEVP